MPLPSSFSMLVRLSFVKSPLAVPPSFTVSVPLPPFTTTFLPVAAVTVISSSPLPVFTVATPTTVILSFD